MQLSINILSLEQSLELGLAVLLVGLLDPDASCLLLFARFLGLLTLFHQRTILLNVLQGQSVLTALLLYVPRLFIMLHLDLLQ